MSGHRESAKKLWRNVFLGPPHALPMDIYLLAPDGKKRWYSPPTRQISLRRCAIGFCGTGLVPQLSPQSLPSLALSRQAPGYGRTPNGARRGYIEYLPIIPFTERTIMAAFDVPSEE